MVCSICGLASHNARQCSKTYCESIIHELVDSIFTIQLTVKSTMEANNGELLLAVLMGTHDRLGEHSPWMSLAGHTDLIVNILSRSKHVSNELFLCKENGLDQLDEMEYYIGNNRDGPSPQIVGHYCYMLQYNSNLTCYPYSYNILDNSSSTVVSSLRRYGSSVWRHDGNVEILWFYIANFKTIYVYNAERVLKCYSPEISTPIWRYYVEYGTSANRITVDNNSIYMFCYLDNKNYILCVRDGKFAWRQNVNQRVITEITLFNDTLYFATMNSIYMMASKKGKILHASINAILDETLIVDRDNIVIFITFNTRIECLDVKEGNRIWQNDTIIPSDTKPAVFKDLVLVVSREKHLVALDKYTGKHLWTNKIGTKILNTPCTTDYYIYIGCLNKKVYKINPENGKIMWSFKTAGAIEDQILCSNTNIVVLSRGTTCLYLLKK